jgi:hypothetical protein
MPRVTDVATTGTRRGNPAIRIATTLGLGAAAALHVAWAAGITWPAADSDDLADLVVGKRPFPSPRDTAVVAVLLSAATVIVAAPARDGRRGRWHRRAKSAIGLTMIGRGVAGFVLVPTGVYEAGDLFRRWNAQVYSPLCCALGAGALTTAAN